MYSAAAQFQNLTDGERAKMTQWQGVVLDPLKHTPQQITEGQFWQDRHAKLAQGLGEEVQATRGFTLAHKANVNADQPAGGVPVSYAVRPWLHAQQQQPATPPPARQSKAAIVQKAHAGEQELRRELASLEARVNRAIAQATGTQVKPTRATQQPAGLAVSPVTGQPSVLATQIRRGMGMNTGQVLNQHPYNVEQTRRAQVERSAAQYEATQPISPVTGRPSALTAQIRGSVGIEQPAAGGEVVWRGAGGSTLTRMADNQAISPHTGKPSKLTAMMRRSVGIVE